MPDPVIYMDPLPENEGVIFMDPLPASTGIIYMDPIEVNPTGSEIATTDLTWVKWKNNAVWYGIWSSTVWNNTPGSLMYVGAQLTLPAGYKYAMLEYLTNQWQHSAGGGSGYTTELHIKSNLYAGTWESIIETDSTRKISMGNYDPVPAGCGGQVNYNLWIAQ